MDIISLKGLHRIVRFTRGDAGGDGYWYRSETILSGLSLGTTYGTLAEAEDNFLETILLNPDYTDAAIDENKEV